MDPAADVVDDVGDLTAGLAVEPDCRQVVELDAGTALVHSDHWLLRESHCCDTGTTSPFMNDLLRMVDARRSGE